MNTVKKGGGGGGRHGLEPLRQLMGEKLTDEQINQCILKLTQNGVHTIEELAAFPLSQIVSLGLKPKARSVLKIIIPKLNGVYPPNITINS
jgi:hypothetical protein